MAKLLQNRIAESGLSLPLMLVVSLVVWVLAGLIEQQWWGQLVCFAVATYLMVELSNDNALLRVRSRMVSCTFLSLSCASCFLLGSLSAGIVQLCMVAAIIILFHTYQTHDSPGWMYYAFLCVGLASLVFVQVLYFVPFLWLMAITDLQSLNWRSWAASLLGLATPYWFAAPYFIYQKDFTFFANHFAGLASLPFPYDYTTLTVSQVVAFAFIVVLVATGIVHFWLFSVEDRIRIRQLYAVFIKLSLLTIVFIMLQPQHYSVLLRMLIVTASPIIAHFLTLTHSKVTNVVFIASMVLALLITMFNLVQPLIASWTGS